MRTNARFVPFRDECVEPVGRRPPKSETAHSASAKDIRRRKTGSLTPRRSSACLGGAQHRSLTSRRSAEPRKFRQFSRARLTPSAALVAQEVHWTFAREAGIARAEGPSVHAIAKRELACSMLP